MPYRLPLWGLSKDVEVFLFFLHYKKITITGSRDDIATVSPIAFDQVPRCNSNVVWFWDRNIRSIRSYLLYEPSYLLLGFRSLWYRRLYAPVSMMFVSGRRTFSFLSVIRSYARFGCSDVSDSTDALDAFARAAPSISQRRAHFSCP